MTADNRKICRFREFSTGSVMGMRMVDVHSFDLMRTWIREGALVRYRPLVRYLSRAMRHRVMILSDGDAWSQTHKAIGKALHPRMVEAEYQPVVEQVAREAFETLVSAGDEVEIEPLMRTVASSVMGYVLFGEALPLAEAAFVERTLSDSTEARAKALSSRLNRGTAAAFGVLRMPLRQPVLFHRSQQRAIVAIFRWLYDRVERLDAAESRPALFDDLAARYAELPRRKRNKRIASEYVMLLVAGIETTASAMTMSLAEIAANAEVRERVLQEVRGASDAAQPVSARYAYLNAVFCEALRRHTVVPTMLREAKASTRLSGTDKSGSRCPYQLLKGTAVRYLPLVGHMRRDIWDKPKSFQPERFLRPLTAEQSKHYVPFGFGQQRCPGHTLARTEALVVMAEFLRRFDVEQKTLKGVTMALNIVFTNRPVGVRLKVMHAEAAGVA